MRPLVIAPSILSSHFGHLERDVKAAERAGAGWIHVDVMDGHFVPNLTIGPGVTAAIREATKLPVDVHLMIERPEQLIPQFVEAGADRITVHQEACPHLSRVIGQIHDAGLPAGVALNPATPVDCLEDVIAFVDLVLVMTVNPGFGGQSFLPGSEGKVRRARQLIAEAGREAVVDLQVDGGIDVKTAPEVVRAGANVLVAGSALFSGGEGALARRVPELRSAAERGLQLP